MRRRSTAHGVAAACCLVGRGAAGQPHALAPQAVPLVWQMVIAASLACDSGPREACGGYKRLPYEDHGRSDVRPGTYIHGARTSFAAILFLSHRCESASAPRVRVMRVCVCQATAQGCSPALKPIGGGAVIRGSALQGGCGNTQQKMRKSAHGYGAEIGVHGLATRLGNNHVAMRSGERPALNCEHVRRV